MNGVLDVDHTSLGALVARRWSEQRPDLLLNERAHEGWLEAAWRQGPERSSLELHWSRRTSSNRVAASPAVAQVKAFVPLS